MKTTFSPALPELLMFAALILGTAAALAAEPVPPGRAPAAQATPAQAAFARYDADRDGVLSMQEMARHPMGAHASMADANRDGVLAAAEFAALEAMH